MKETASSVVEKPIIVGSILAFTLLSLGTILLLNSTTPLEKKETILSDTFNVSENRYENRSAWLKNDVNYIVSFSVSEDTIKFYAMSEGTLSAWLQHQFEPAWIESQYHHFALGGTGAPEGGMTWYFVFFNNNTSTKEVHIEVSNAWTETNYIGLLEGAALVLSGGIISIIMKLRYNQASGAAYGN
jgi:hypothetical protein